MSVEVVFAGRARVGECPLWCPRDKRLYWVDSLGLALNRLDPATGRNEAFAMPAAIGSLALEAGGRLIVALASGFHRLADPAAPPEPIGDPEPDRPANRLNDGRCDRDGRFWCGSMTPGNVGARRDGQLHRLAGGRIATIAGGFGTVNGIAFSPDGCTMYVSDSHPAVRTIWRYAYDRDAGVPHDPQVFHRFAAGEGRPDGAAVDADGCYWSAAVDGGAVVRLTPDGRIDRRIALPVSKPSMPAFGGAGLRTMFVTSIAEGVGEEEPLAGAIFALDPGVAGLAEPLYAG